MMLDLFAECFSYCFRTPALSARASYLRDQSHHLYFYYCKVKDKMELSEFVLLMRGVAAELTFGAKLSNWRAHANVCILSGWELVFPWTQTSVKWHDIWKWLLQDWLISALKTSDSPTILNAKALTSFVNIKQNNCIGRFSDSLGKKHTLLPQKKSTSFPLWMSLVVVNSDNQRPVCTYSALCGRGKTATCEI